MSILRVYDPSECDAAGVPLDWERCRCQSFAMTDDVSCQFCLDQGSLKAAALDHELRWQRSEHIYAQLHGEVLREVAFMGRCTSCSHPMSEGTWEDHSRVPHAGVLAGDEGLRRTWVRWAFEELRAGREPTRLDDSLPQSDGRVVHYSPCDEACTHGGPIRWKATWADEPHTWMPEGPLEAVPTGKGVANGTTIEASWRPIDIRTLGWPHDLRPEKLAVLCLRCFAAKSTESKPSGEGTHA